MEEHETTTKIDDEKVEKSTTETTTKVKDASPTTPSPSSNSNATWWGGWISQAKEKSASVLEAVRNDLNEITTAVTETLNLVPTDEELNNESEQDPAGENSGGVNFTHMKQSISSSISTFFGSVTDALVPQLDEDDTSEAILISNDDSVVLTGFSKHLKELQENDETYLEEPSKTALAEKYRMWLEIVEQDQFTQPRIEKMLQQSQVLNEKYNNFVPDIVSHMNFFKRYLFKRALLEDELASEERTKKEDVVVIEKQPEPAIVVEAPIAIESPPQIKKNEGSGDLDIANYELSEEEQARLLEAYELEIKEREKKGDVFVEPEELPKVATKSQKSAKKSLNVQSKSNAAASVTSSASKGKNNKDLKNQQHQPQKSTQQQKSKNQAKLAGNNQTKESESSTSDESWEKDFDM